jgi:hypothetical protein
MLERFIDREIRRTNRNLLLLSGCTCMLLLLLCGVTWRYWYNFLGGPAPINAEALGAITDPGAVTRYFVTAQGDKTVSTGLREITITRSKYTRTERSRRTTAQYVALLTRGRKALLVKSPTETTATTFSGALVPIPADIRGRLGKDIEVFLPYMLDAGGFRAPGYWSLGFGVPVMLLSLWGLSLALRRRSDPGQHPLMRRLSSLGQASEIAAHIDREIAAPPGATAYGPALLTESFMLRSTAFGTAVMRHQDLIWVHGKVTKHSTNGIPTGTT